MNCDFCLARSPAWIYPADDFELRFPPGHASQGPWAACERCHTLIEQELWTELARTAAVRFLNRHQLPKEDLPGIHGLHQATIQQFRQHRTGTPRQAKVRDLLARREPHYPT